MRRVRVKAEEEANVYNGRIIINDTDEMGCGEMEVHIGFILLFFHSLVTVS